MIQPPADHAGGQQYVQLVHRIEHGHGLGAGHEQCERHHKGGPDDERYRNASVKRDSVHGKPPKVAKKGQKRLGPHDGGLVLESLLNVGKTLEAEALQVCLVVNLIELLPLGGVIHRLAFILIRKLIVSRPSRCRAHFFVYLYKISVHQHLEPLF